MVKGTKVLNPADKARKEARRKELKKNKKQRQQVRSAAIERRDPEQIISDLEKLDSLEFDISTNPTTSDSFYKDKRKRLLETWTKILAYYAKEDPERHAKLKKLENDYEIKHKKLAREFEGIKAAQELKIEDVFLPLEPNSAIDDIADDDPLFSKSIYITPLNEDIKPPGCPPGLPPDFKQIVDTLKTCLVGSNSIEQLALPNNLISLSLPQIVMSGSAESEQYRQQQSRKRQRSDIEHQRFDQHKLRIKNPTRQKQVTNKKFATATVIESKPVIFKPKATKFVPSSVRQKLKKDDSK